MKQTVKTTEVSVVGNAELGTKDKKLLYLIIGEGVEKVVINVGEKTYKSVRELEVMGGVEEIAVKDEKVEEIKVKDEKPKK